VCCRLQVAPSGESYEGKRRPGRKQRQTTAGYIWRDSLHVTWGLTAYTPGSAPGPTLGNEYGKTLPFFSTVMYLSVTVPQESCRAPYRSGSRRSSWSSHTGASFVPLSARPSSFNLWPCRSDRRSTTRDYCTVFSGNSVVGLPLN